MLLNCYLLSKGYHYNFKYCMIRVNAAMVSHISTSFIMSTSNMVQCRKNFLIDDVVNPRSVDFLVGKRTETCF